MQLLLLMFLAGVLAAVLPIWRYNASWSYFPSGGITLALILLIAMASLDQI